MGALNLGFLYKDGQVDTRFRPIPLENPLPHEPFPSISLTLAAIMTDRGMDLVHPRGVSPQEGTA